MLFHMHSFFLNGSGCEWGGKKGEEEDQNVKVERKIKIYGFLYCFFVFAYCFSFQGRVCQMLELKNMRQQIVWKMYTTDESANVNVGPFWCW